jgi:hypothetical protein
MPQGWREGFYGTQEEWSKSKATKKKKKREQIRDVRTSVYAVGGGECVPRLHLQGEGRRDSTDWIVQRRKKKKKKK